VPSSIGTVPLDFARDPEPTAGEDVRQHTYSSRDNGSPIESTGTYLGRGGDIVSGRSSDIDLVAIDPASVDLDACFYGASGSSAVLASGRITGPLSVRNTIGYGPDRVLDPEDGDGGRWQRLQFEDTTHVDLQGVTVICGYAAYDAPLVDALLTALR
jgi:hypothetical protein